MRVKVHLLHTTVDAELAPDSPLSVFTASLPPYEGDAALSVNGKPVTSGSATARAAGAAEPSARLEWMPASEQKHSVHLRWLKAGVRAHLGAPEFWLPGAAPPSEAGPLRRAALRHPPRRLAIGARGGCFVAAWEDGAFCGGGCAFAPPLPAFSVFWGG